MENRLTGELLFSDGSLRIMIATLLREGLDPAPAIAAAGFDPETRTLQREILPEQERAFQRAFLAITGHRPDLWLRMGMEYSLGVFGQFALLMMTAPNLRTLLTNRDLSRVGFHGVNLRPIMIEGSLIGVELDLSSIPEDLRDMALLVSIGCILRLYRELVGEDFTITMVSLPMADEGGALSRIAGVPINPEAQRALVLWPGNEAERPLRTANPVLYKAYAAAVRDLLRAPVSQEDFRLRLSEAVARSMNMPSPLTHVARAMGMTPRTLQRRLSDMGLRFRDLLDERRRERAIQALIFQDLPLTEIGWKLGYSDLAGFTHAFQRWTGSTPGRFRRQAREAEAQSNGGRRR